MTSVGSAVRDRKTLAVVSMTALIVMLVSLVMGGMALTSQRPAEAQDLLTEWVQSDPVTVPPGSPDNPGWAIVEVKCPEGKTAIGGGANGEAGRALLNSSFPTQGNPPTAWKVKFFNLSQESASVVAYAGCTGQATAMVPEIPPASP